MKNVSRLIFVVTTLAIASLGTLAIAQDTLVYEGTEGVGKGKHIVFIANDHEYRSEQTCPLMAKILAKRYGFRCTVLFGVDKDGFIKAGAASVPGMETLKDADLLFFYTRFMNLPDAQVDLLVEYFERGGPVVGLRTSTHCFNGQQGKWSKLNFNYEGEDYRGGLGEQVLGNTWHRQRGQSHYGANHRMGCTIMPAQEASGHPILAGVRDIHAYSGAYLSRPPVGSDRLLDVKVLNTFGPSDDVNTDKAVVNAGWTRDHYTAPSGKKKNSRVVYSSLGASEDLLDEDARRFLVNASLWAVGLEDKIDAQSNVDIVGTYQPTFYTNGIYVSGVKPTDLSDWDSEIMPAKKLTGLADERAKKRLKQVLKNRQEMRKRLAEIQPEVFN